MKRKSKKRIKKIVISLMLVAISLPLFNGFAPQKNNQGLAADPQLMRALLEAQQGEQETETMPVLPDIEGEYQVVEILDGTSFSIMYGDEEKTVKLIGITVPEDMREKARLLLEAELSDIDTVSLEFDEKDKDKKGNLLAYAYLPDDPFTTINSILLLNGFAKFDDETENKRYIEDLRSAERQARQNEVGIWKTDSVDEENIKNDR